MAKRKKTSVLDSLTQKERIFVHEYAADGNGTRAATEAGYGTPQSMASRMLNKPKIKAALKEVMEPVLKESRLTVERLANQLANYVYRTIKDFVDESGCLITRVSELPDEVAQCVEGWEVEEIWGYSREEKTREQIGQKIKVKLVSKARMQELAMKYTKMVGPDININQQNNTQINIGDALWAEAQEPVVDVVAKKLEGK